MVPANKIDIRLENTLVQIRSTPLFGALCQCGRQFEMKVIFLLVAFLAGVANAASTRNLLAACGAPDPKSTAPPLNALLYVSGATQGVAKYECDTTGKPKQTPVSVDGNFINPEGWVGVVFRNDDGDLQFDLSLKPNGTKETVKSTVILDNEGAVFETPPGAISFGRWPVKTTKGDGPPFGLVPLAWATRIDPVGGGPGDKKCQPGETIKSDYNATYNLYTCESAYLAPLPAPAAAPVPSVAPIPAAATPPPTIAVPAPAPTVAAPVPAPAAAPVVPVVTPVVAAIPSPQAAPPPASGALTFASGKAVAALIFSAALMFA